MTQELITAVCQLAILRMREAAKVAANTLVFEHTDAACDALTALAAGDAKTVDACLEAERKRLDAESK